MDTILLFFMLLTYSFVGLYCFYLYDHNNSLSNIIYNDTNILIGMGIMSGITILYEMDRKSTTSIIAIFILIISILCVLMIEESNTYHIIAAIMAFMSICLFMYNEKYDSKTLNCMFYSQIVISLYLIYRYLNNKNIIYTEIILLLNFAIYYIYLHKIS